jgi:hypothetical protein
MERTMASRSVRDRVLEELERLGPEDRERILDFARHLGSAPARGTRGTDLLRFAGAVSSEAAEEMTRAIEEGCERIDVSEW